MRSHGGEQQGGSTVAAASVQLHRRFLEALGDHGQLRDPDGLCERPLDVVASPPLPARLRVYLYTMTTHESERQAGAYRIQITLPGLRRGGGRAFFDYTDDPDAVLLAGYNEDLDVFALWDASLIEGVEGIPFSRGCQVRDVTLYEAMLHGVAEQRRGLRGQHTVETLIAARPSHLVEGIVRRWRRTTERLAPPVPHGALL